MKIIDRFVTKAERQNILDKILKEEIERLRKICFRYQRREMFYHDVTIGEAISPENNKFAGRYECIVNPNIKYEYIHKITIDTRHLGRYTNFSKRQYRTDYYTKKDYKRLLVSTVRHEICHAFIRERFEFMSNLKDIEHDGSPIYLAFLYFVGGTSNHDCVKAFKHSDLYKTAINMDNYKQLEHYLVNLIIQYNHVAIDMKEQYEENKYIINNYSYAARSSKFYPCIVLKDIMVARLENNKLKTMFTQYNNFEVGCNITPQMVRTLTIKKMNEVDNFRYKKINKQYCINVNTVKTVEIANTCAV